MGVQFKIMNRLKLKKLLDECYEVVEHERNEFHIELLEALLEPEYDPDLGKTESSLSN